MEQTPRNHPTGRRLVIFGCGYVGSGVARQARARGLAVTALTRNAERAEALRADGVEVVIADLAGDDWHERIEGGADWVLNCVSSGGGTLAAYRHSYVDGMKSILAWARSRGPAGTISYTSSTSVYPHSGGVRVDEEAATVGIGEERPGLLVAAEALLRESADACRRWFVLRLAGIYGPERHHLLEQVRSGEVSGRGDHHLNMIHREDICRAVWAAFEAPENVASQVFNVVDDHPATKAEVTGWLAERVAAPPLRFSGSPAPGRRSVTPDRLIANDRIKSVLGWRPLYPSFREGYENVLSLSGK
jgi:nucleoside-diphosphate-sugar epimerase